MAVSASRFSLAARTAAARPGFSCASTRLVEPLTARLRTHFRAAYYIRLLCADIAHVKNTFCADACLVYDLSAPVIGYEERGKKLRMANPKKNKNKAKLNLTVRDGQRNKLEQMASLENRSVSNLIEVMADERWKRLAEQQGVLTLKPFRRKICSCRAP